MRIIIDPTATRICKVLQDAGHQAVLAGGAVRDILLLKQPHDWDIATSADPDTVLVTLLDAGFRVREVGKAFGVILAKIDDTDFEIATFRTEAGFTDGRHPDTVTYSTMEEDAARRDLTINAMFFDPISEKFHDFVGGGKDIQDHVIRFVGDPVERITEDKLRMLRAVRFATKFNWAMDPGTFGAIRSNAPKILDISQERINMELQKMLCSGNPVRAMTLLNGMGLLDSILPEVSRLCGLEQDSKNHPEGDVWTHTLLVMEALKTTGSFELLMAGMLHDVGKFSTFSRDAKGMIHFFGHEDVGASEAVEILKRLKFSNDQIELITSLIRDHMKMHIVKLMKTSTLRRLIAQPNFKDLLCLGNADCIGSGKKTDAIDFIAGKAVELSLKEEPYDLPEALVNGNDLIALGLKPSVRFKEILTFAMDLQLEGVITTKESGLVAVKKKFSI